MCPDRPGAHYHKDGQHQMYFALDGTLHSTTSEFCLTQLRNNTQVRIFSELGASVIIENQDYRSLCGCLEFSEQSVIRLYQKSKQRPSIPVRDSTNH